jgi:hypothetical protein
MRDIVPRFSPPGRVRKGLMKTRDCRHDRVSGVLAGGAKVAVEFAVRTTGWSGMQFSTVQIGAQVYYSIRPQVVAKTTSLS